MRCSEVGWDASSRRGDPEAAQPASSVAWSAAANSGARPWLAVKRSAANSACRLTAADARGQRTADSATKSGTPPTVHWPCCRARSGHRHTRDHDDHLSASGLAGGQTAGNPGDQSRRQAPRRGKPPREQHRPGHPGDVMAELVHQYGHQLGLR
jgi:hypothetical protein